MPSLTSGVSLIWLVCRPLACGVSRNAQLNVNSNGYDNSIEIRRSERWRFAENQPHTMLPDLVDSGR